MRQAAIIIGVIVGSWAATIALVWGTLWFGYHIIALTVFGPIAGK